MTLAVSIAQGGSNNVTMRNRIINGAMMITQRGIGPYTNTTSPIYTLDRWAILATVASKFTAQQSSSAPPGFSNSLLLTSSSAYSVGASDYFLLRQPIEGFNTADFSFGTANAKTVTLSFWVQSSLTGTFSAALYNETGNRCYPFAYAISSANTWTQISVSIPGDQSGTWVGATNGIGLYVNFNLAVGSTYSGSANTWGTAFGVTGATSLVGTNGATMYITGVQLEAGTTATPFEQRLYGQELALCQRYYFRITGADSYSIVGVGTAYNTTTSGRIQIPFPVPMRTTPTPSFGGTIYLVGNTVSAAGFTLGTTYGGKLSLMQDITWSTAMSAAGVGIVVYTLNTSSDYFQLTAEL